MKITKGHRKLNLCPENILHRLCRILVVSLFIPLLSTNILWTTAVHAQSDQKQSSLAENRAPGIFRLERVPVDRGAELITIHAQLSGLKDSEDGKWVPVVTVLRDTLGDLSPENDRLRYVWPLTYTRPTLRQRVSGAVPFLYSRVGNKKGVINKAPPPVLDLAAPEKDVWNRIFWTALQSLLLDPYGAPVKASSRSYERNISDYRKSHIIRALSVLSLYQAVKGPEAFTETEMTEIQGRLLLTDKTFGGIVDSLQVGRFSERTSTGAEDARGHNWELLRQRAESESLIFEPLQMPDGTSTHALLWVSKAELVSRQKQNYSKRFLNVDDPWSDKRLLNWKGYTETRYVDSNNRAVSVDTPGATSVEMIPLALYGLDHPKIPAVLVDFRDGLNPKKREMSRRVLQDVTRNVLSLSKFGDVPYFLGRTIFDFVTGRRGMDINQPSRLRAYSQLKLLLALDQSMSAELRDEVNHRLEKISLNPMENDLEVEAKIAREQYAALLVYAKAEGGLPAKLDRDRRAELVPLEHGRVERVLFRLANILTFGKYSHREEAAPDNDERLNIARRLTHHTSFLREVAQSSPRIDVVWNLDEVRRSLRYIAEHGTEENTKAVSAMAKIFNRTEDDETRRICIESLSRINSPRARKELIRISQQTDLGQSWKDLIAAYLKNPKQLEPLAASGSSPNDQRPAQQ